MDNKLNSIHIFTTKKKKFHKRNNIFVYFPNKIKILNYAKYYFMCVFTFE